jgi:hypothetical protein
MVTVYWSIEYHGYCATMLNNNVSQASTKTFTEAVETSDF